MDKDKVIHIYLAHPPSTIFYLPVNMGNKVGQVSYFDGIQPHVFNAHNAIYACLQMCDTTQIDAIVKRHALLHSKNVLYM